MNVQQDNYITIQGWMVTNLKLKGNDLLVYAIIYGFSQNGETEYDGSLQYLADWCGSTKQGIQKNLKNLLDRNLIQKRETYKNNIKYCSYSCMVCNKVAQGMQHSCINNIEDNNTILSKDKIDEQPPTDTNSFIGSASKRDIVQPKKTERKMSLYDKCTQSVMEFTDDVALQNALFSYLPVRLANKDKPLYGVNQWVGMLNRLRDLDGDKVVIVNQSTERGWCSFYEVKDDRRSGGVKNFSCEVGVKSVQMTSEEQNKELLLLERRRQNGQRTSF